MKILIKNGKVLVPEGEYFKIADADVSVEDKLIDGIYPHGTEEEGYDRIIDASDRLVMPGLINAHTHAYMSLFRNYADDLDFFDWLGKVQAAEDYLTPEDCYWGTMLSVIEMLKTGTTCFVDMNLSGAQNGAESGPEGACAGAVYDSGIRAYLSRGLVGEADDEGSERRFREFFKDMEIHKDHDRVNFIFGPHAPYSAAQSLLKKTREYAEEYNMGATVHISESRAEMEQIGASYNGKTPVQYVAESGLFEVPTIAAHCVYATEDDMDIFRKYGVSIAVNNKSNMKLGNGFAPVEKFLEKGINICLGTDGSGSNNTQNMFQEMNSAALVYKGSSVKAKCVDAADILRAATTGGAKALGMEGKLGVIKEGAIADIILLDLNVPQFYPRNNIISGLVYAANGSEVRTVMVNGRLVMEEGKLLTIDAEKVYEQCENIAVRVGMHG
ncbi:MAG: amidohydrolase [Parasporobacterium sp.]|nr:amidohydrolase [Parasporobacterium sp.]